MCWPEKLNNMRTLIEQISSVADRLRMMIARAVIAAIARRNGVVIFYAEPERIRALEIIRRIKGEVRSLLSDHEAYQIYMAVQRTAKIPGDIAEVGAYRGGSAKLICEAKGDRALHLFDTFEGLPEISEIDEGMFKRGQYGASAEEVKKYLSGYPQVFIYKGVFPGTGDPIRDKRFSFVHLDVDIYESTRAALDFFYPRMARGGVMISHDYINSPGVRKAVDEFFADKPEAVLESSRWQCLVVKL